MVIVENRKPNMSKYISNLSNEELDKLLNIAYEEKKKRAVEKYKSRQSLEYKSEPQKEEVKEATINSVFKEAYKKAKVIMDKIVEIRKYFKSSDKVLFRTVNGEYFYKSKTDKNQLAYIYSSLEDYSRKAFYIEFDPNISEELRNSYSNIFAEANNLLDDLEQYLDYVKDNAKTYGNTKIDKDILKQLDGYNNMLKMTNSGVQILDKGYDIQAIKCCKKAYRKIQKNFNK